MGTPRDLCSASQPPLLSKDPRDLLTHCCILKNMVVLCTVIKRITRKAHYQPLP